MQQVQTQLKLIWHNLSGLTQEVYKATWVHYANQHSYEVTLNGTHPPFTEALLPGQGSWPILSDSTRFKPLSVDVPYLQGLTPCECRRCI